MPAKNVEQLKAKTTALKKKLAEKGKSMDGPKLRALKKKIRRSQRRRRSMAATAARVAAAGKKEKAG